MAFLLIIVVVLVMLGGLPQVSGQWHQMGYGISGVGGVIILVLVVLLLTGRL